MQTILHIHANLLDKVYHKGNKAACKSNIVVLALPRRVATNCRADQMCAAFRNQLAEPITVTYYACLLSGTTYLNGI